MYWIALNPSPEERSGWAWRALQFTPRVAELDEALLLEIGASERLFGGRGRLMRQLLASRDCPLHPVSWAGGATALIALALLRLKCQGLPRPADIPEGLGLQLLTAASDHLTVLDRTGVRTWGELRRLPRTGVARRFGPGLLAALDAAWGGRAESFDWLQLPDTFDSSVELDQPVTTVPELVSAAGCMLASLQVWLRARHHGLVALEFEWALDLKRHDGVDLPPSQVLEIRTASPTQDVGHLRRLAGEHLARIRLAAPACRLRLRTLVTEPWEPPDASLLPEDKRRGERLHELVERLSARMGPGQVVVPLAREDWRPERMQCWMPAIEARPCGPAPRAGDGLYPLWLLPEPLPLQTRDHRPWHRGPLRLRTRRHRVETAWWEATGAVVRDYYIASGEAAGLVWIYCEHSRAADGAVVHKEVRWYLQGLYA